MKVVLTILMLVSGSLLLNAVQPCSAPIPTPAHAVNPDNCIKIKIRILHGKWDDATQNCVGPKGLCKIVIYIYVQHVGVEDREGNGEMWYDNGGLHLVALSDQYDAESFAANYSDPTFLLGADFHLSDELCDALGLQRGYIIPKGEYPLRNAGGAYSGADREIRF